jgi:hypothetical protein
MEQLAIETRGDAVVRAAQADGAADDRIKDGLYVGRRNADHAKDLAGRRLLFERLGQAFLELWFSINTRRRFPASRPLCWGFVLGAFGRSLHLRPPLDIRRQSATQARV